LSASYVRKLFRPKIILNKNLSHFASKCSFPTTESTKKFHFNALGGHLSVAKCSAAETICVKERLQDLKINWEIN